MNTVAERECRGVCEQKLEFIVFSDDWGAHPSSSQHLFRHIAREHSVIWINTIGMRTPRLRVSDLAKAGRKLTRMCIPHLNRTRSDPADLHLQVYQPFMLPYSSVAAVRELNARSVLRTVQRASNAAARSAEVIVVATAPNAGDYCAALPDATVVYYCVDDFTQWPELDAKTVRDMEQKLIRRADVLVAVSERLCARLAGHGKRVHLLTHGVDAEVFRRPVSREHPYLSGIPKPRVGFFGLIDARVDQELLLSVAQRMTDVSFVLAGPVEVSMKRLANCANVHLTGALPYLELPDLVFGLDLLFIPYRAGALGDSLSPLKLKEYLVTGKPVISTPIREARAPLIAIAQTVEDWIYELRRGLEVATDAGRTTAMAAMEGESWSSKACEFLALCADTRSVDAGLSSDAV